MSSTSFPETPLGKVIRHELQAIRGKWIWLVVLGIALILLGIILLGSPVIATLATVTAIGVLILLGGGMDVVGAFSRDGADHAIVAPSTHPLPVIRQRVYPLSNAFKCFGA